MRKLFDTLWARFAFTIVLLIMMIMASVTYVFTVRQLESKRREVRDNMGRLAKQIASIRLAETEGWYVYQDWIDNIINSDFSRDIVYIAIFDETDSLAAFSLNRGLVDVGSEAPLSRREQANIIRQFSQGEVAEESRRDFDRQPVDIRWGDEFLGTVDVGFSLVELNDAVRRSLFINLALLGVFSIVGLLASVIVSRRVTGPINRLSMAMMRVSRGDLDQEVAIEGRGEVGHLASTYNFMIHGLRQKEVIEIFSRDLGFTFELEKVAERVSEGMTRAVGSERGLLLIRKGDALHPVWDFPNGTVARIGGLSAAASSYEKIARWREPVDIEQLQRLRGWEPGLSRLLREFAMAPGIAVPIVAKEKLLSLLLLGAKFDGTAYMDAEKQFLATLAGQAAFAIENALLLDELTEQERLKRELEIARGVQMRLLPQKAPDLSGLDIFGLCVPAEEVGGDYYDYFPLDNERVGIAIADVSGKGIPAAFYMAEIKGMMTSLTRLLDSPKAILCQVNERLFHSSDRSIFATMIYAVADLPNRELRFARAGHSPLLFKKDGEGSQVESLTPPGIGLGMAVGEVFDSTLAERSLTLDWGDTLILYTDGLSEARNSSLEEFGERRLEQAMAEHPGGSMEALSIALLGQVERFAAGAKQHDDITMIALQVRESE